VSTRQVLMGHQYAYLHFSPICNAQTGDSKTIAGSRLRHGNKLQNPSLSPNWIILGSRALVIRPRLELPNSLPGGFQFG